MPAPIPVELRPHDPHWIAQAAEEAAKLRAAIGNENLVAVHHIGSTSIPSIHAKPILDLMPVAKKIELLDDRRTLFVGIGYEWWGEYGLPGRRYCTKSDPQTGRRLVQVHCYAEGSAAAARHLAFRDYLRAHPSKAAEYDNMKQACRDRHPNDSHAYTDCKDEWIKSTEAAALIWAASQ